MPVFSYDIVIIGGGMVGASLACLLAQQTNLSIAVLESQAPSYSWDESSYHHRVSALALSSRSIFRTLNVWDEIQHKRVSPFTNIHVWDAISNEEINFNSRKINEVSLGYIVENNLIQSILQKKLQQNSQIEFIAPVTPAALKHEDHHTQVVTADGNIYQAKLFVAADGAHSWLREQSNIALDYHHYQQEAIVATVETELSSDKEASQVFLPTGPLAFLPLAKPNLSSIVWSLPVAMAQRMLTLSDEEFKIELSSAFSHRLGKVLEVDKRHVFSLAKQQAKNYVKPRLALVGDAAHTIHPLAGQGVNMGLLDAACLAEIIANAINKHRDFASLSNLRRYERWRKADNLGLLVGVDIIKNLFASDKKAIQFLRATGLNITQHTDWIKNMFTRYAVGIRNDLPKAAI